MYLRKFHSLYIQGTAPHAIITIAEIHLCSLSNAVKRVITKDRIEEKVKVYVTTRMLKHLYDKKPAEEYDSIINLAHTITKYPDQIYKNKDSKRGDFAFVKDCNDSKYICCV